MEWFKTWFASPYYHVLYKNRDHAEAELFMDNLLKQLDPKADAKFLDLACGAGRHSIFINSKGFNVIGTDLSEPSIIEAKKSENETLDFYVQDMRRVFRTNYFDFILNLFTSFGYFERTSDNVKVIEACKKGLRENGRLVIDFMNATKVVSNLVEIESKTVDGIEFHINRRCDGKHIYKNIQFKAEGKDYDFTEKVQYLTLKHFDEIAEKAGMKIEQTFGDFELSPFNKYTSDRLIMVLSKC